MEIGYTYEDWQKELNGYMNAGITTREITAAGQPLLEEVICHIIFLPSGVVLPREIAFKPEVFMYVKGFGGKGLRVVYSGE